MEAENRLLAIDYSKIVFTALTCEAMVPILPLVVYLSMFVLGGQLDLGTRTFVVLVVLLVCGTIAGAVGAAVKSTIPWLGGAIAGAVVGLALSLIVGIASGSFDMYFTGRGRVIQNPLIAEVVSVFVVTLSAVAAGTIAETKRFYLWQLAGIVGGALGGTISGMIMAMGSASLSDFLLMAGLSVAISGGLSALVGGVSGSILLIIGHFAGFRGERAICRSVGAALGAGFGAVIGTVVLMGIASI